MPVELPAFFVEAIKEQRVVLFLGAGASSGAEHPKGLLIPDGNGLKDMLCDRFLGGQLKHRPLATVAELAANESSLLDVQGFVSDLLREFHPAAYHKLIPTFRWHAIVTTNIDLIIERAYRATGKPQQHLVPFVKNGQAVETELKKHLDGLQYLKLHGCIDHALDSEIPFILANEQFARWSTNRSRLFERFKGWGYELPILFCGYSISDPHIQAILFDLFDRRIQRPAYFIVTPGLSDIESRYWSANRITPIKANFDEFLAALNASISIVNRSIPARLGGGESTLRKHYLVAEPKESASLLTFITEDVDHVRPGIPVEQQPPKEFYRGYDTGWGSMAQSLDAHRDVCDSVIVDAVLADEDERQGPVDFYLLTGPAGNGKTICLKRIAWDAAHDYEKIVLFLKEDGAIRADAVEEIHRLTGKRIFLFIDRVALVVNEVKSLIDRARRARIAVTIVAAERLNEWNTRCEMLERHLTREFPVRFLSEKETRKLLDRLETHGALGFLAEKPHEQRIKAFMDAAGRQLLVALHEATLGKPFEGIVLDEYRRILPDEARVLYLDVCTLNRLGAPVRAGLISRVSGLHFEEFQRRFLNPLRYIVIVRHDKYSQDYVYTARHPHVADILFEQALKDPEQRFNQIVRVLRGINLDYTSDETAFRLLTRGRTVAETFTSQELGRVFYDVGEEVLPDDPFLLQQRGIFEMAHKGGSLELAETYIQKAAALKPSDRSIRHSQATLAREQALTATIPLHRAKLRVRAREMLSGLIASDGANPYDFHTKALVAVDELRDLLNETAYGPIDQMAERPLLDAVRDAQLAISNGLQHFPENDRLLVVDADFLELINQHDEAETALRKAFASNPRQDWIAVRLSRKYLARKDAPRALEILNECLSNNPSSKLAHLEMAKLRMASGDIEERSLVREHLRRSFTEGDSNFDAQFWYARELFLNYEHEAALRLFSKLKESSLPPYVRRQLRGFVCDSDGHNTRFAATVIRKEATYCFLRCSKFQPAIFAHISNVESDWGQVTVGSEVEFSLGFTMIGAQACDVRIIPQR